jgi:phosphatidylglycerophosphatase A
MADSPLSPLGKLLVTTFGLGLLRPAPGTWGSMPTVALAGAMILLRARPMGAGPESSAVYHGVLAAVLVIFSWACVRFGASAEAHFGKKDPGSVVADETAGQAITLCALPIAATTGLHHLIFTLALAFVAFRACDIAKVWPANGLQKIRGGWGILLDDLVAGAQAMVIVQVVVRVVWGW